MKKKYKKIYRTPWKKGKYVNLMDVAKKLEYQKIMNSVVWKVKSKRWITETEYCEKCSNPEKNTAAGHFSCHHKHYNTLGRESRDDIEVLCWKCHREKHYWKDKIDINETIEKDKRWKQVKKTLKLNI